jgi:hypothetical protein
MNEKRVSWAYPARVRIRPNPYPLSKSPRLTNATVPDDVLEALAACAPPKVLEHGVLPINFACLNLIALDRDGVCACSDVASPVRRRSCFPSLMRISLSRQPLKMSNLAIQTVQITGSSRSVISPIATQRLPSKRLS